VAKYVLDNFDWVEDLSVPEVYWESIFQRHGRDAGGMRRLNRLEMWAWWLGMEIDRADTCIRSFDDAEVGAACDHWRLVPGEYVALSVKTLHDAKDYPYYEELADMLRDELGLTPVFLHTHPVPSKHGTIHGRTVREMGAIIAGSSLTVCCDTAAMHWAGILNCPAVALFTSNDAETYLRYYKTVRGLQVCDTPCILNGWTTCGRRVETTLGHDGRSCYPNCNRTILGMAHSALEEAADEAVSGVR
jgi:ADP-heptose:LPS heptosyltransferase